MSQKNIDFSLLDKYSDEEVKKFNEELEYFMSGKSDKVSREATAYFYLFAHRLETGFGFYAWLYYDNITSLEGKVLTLLDGVLPVGKQCEAAKALFRQMLWNQWVASLKRTSPDIPVGMPIGSDREMKLK
jgi:hypothetical protein